ncbi:hypothetical protein [Yinghuangia sp. YIM S10712]|uniref:hypothetical protein n=1 Tax=Yinghuangia sp. YIM S10712 TaxID=3436930 RepID=UPI003F531977
MTPRNHVLGPDGHVDVDILSDLVEGLLDTEAADEAETHVAVCADCRETRDALVEVRELLGAQPAEPMPDDVFAGIQAAIAEAARADDEGSAADSGASASPETPGIPMAAVTPLRPTPDLGSLPPPRPPAVPEQPQDAPVVHLASARRSRRATGWLLAAAAVAAVVIGVGVSGGFDGSRSSDSSAGAEQNASAPRAEAPSDQGHGAAAPSAAGTRAPSMASLPEYTRANVAERVDALVTRQAAASDTTGSGTAGSDAATSESSDSARTRPAEVPSCVSAAVPDLGTLSAAERARFEGKVVYVLVSQPSGDVARVAIVDAACAEPASTSPQHETSPGGASSYEAPTRSPGTAAPAAPPAGSAPGPAALLYSATVPLR